MNRQVFTNIKKKLKEKKEKKQRNRSSIVLPLTKRVKLLGIKKEEKRKVNTFTISMFEIEEDEMDVFSSGIII